MQFNQFVCMQILYYEKVGIGGLLGLCAQSYTPYNFGWREYHSTINICTYRSIDQHHTDASD